MSGLTRWEYRGWPRARRRALFVFCSKALGAHDIYSKIARESRLAIPRNRRSSVLHPRFDKFRRVTERMLEKLKAMQARGWKVMCDSCGTLFTSTTLNTICPACSEEPYQRAQRLFDEARVDNGEYDCADCATARDFDGDNACPKHAPTRIEVS